MNTLQSIHVIGSADSSMEQRNAFQEVMLRLMAKQTRYDSQAREFLKAFKDSRPEPVKQPYLAPLETTVRRAD